jgi:hypothetical protein
MDINPQLAEKALSQALAGSPQFAQYEPKLVWRPLATGGALFLQYGIQPPAALAGLWDFQNAVVKGYKSMAGV